MEIDSIKKNYRPITTVIITIFIYFAAQIVAAIIFSGIAIILKAKNASALTWIQDNVWTTFGFVLIVEIVTLYLLYIFLKFRKMTFKQIGLNNPNAKYIGYALGGFAVYFVLYILGLAVSKALVPELNLDQKQEIGFNTTTTGISLIPVFFSLVILPPITEEIVARGFLFGGLRTKLPLMVSAVITSILFASAHLGGAKDGLLWVAAIDTFMLSLVLCYLREKTGSLWPSIGLHAMKNGLAFVVLFNITQYFR